MIITIIILYIIICRQCLHV